MLERKEHLVNRCTKLARMLHFHFVKTLSGATTHQHIHIEDPAVFPCTDAEALQIHAVFVVEDFVERIAQLRPQLLASSALKLRGCIG